jgi:ferric-dicitrate binding protein FerR (iron transport regulator)
MDTNPSYNDLLWELLVQALQGELSPDDDRRFREWLALSEENRMQYEQLQRIWKDGMGDYVFYREANEVKGWEDLRGRMSEGKRGRIVGEESGRMGDGEEGKRGEGRKMGEEETIGNKGGRVVAFKRWGAVAAAVLVLAVGAGWWYMSGRGAGMQYETAAGEQRTISLADGSQVVLNGQAQIRVGRDYDKTDRTVTLVGGVALFEVAHQAQRPFTVDAGAVSIKDIGTTFTVERTKDSVKVVVSEGKIAFTEKETGQSREMTAGDAICFYIAEKRVREEPRMRFDNAPLSEVVTALQKMSGKRILLSDPAMGEKRLTVHLAGESFEDALKTVCASLNLEYTVVNEEYVLKSRDGATHN